MKRGFRLAYAYFLCFDQRTWYHGFFQIFSVAIMVRMMDSLTRSREDYGRERF